MQAQARQGRRVCAGSCLPPAGLGSSEVQVPAHLAADLHCTPPTAKWEFPARTGLESKPNNCLAFQPTSACSHPQCWAPRCTTACAPGGCTVHSVQPGVTGLLYRGTRALYIPGKGQLRPPGQVVACQLTLVAAWLQVGTVAIARSPDRLIGSGAFHEHGVRQHSPAAGTGAGQDHRQAAPLEVKPDWHSLALRVMPVWALSQPGSCAIAYLAPAPAPGQPNERGRPLAAPEPPVPGRSGAAAASHPPAWHAKEARDAKEAKLHAMGDAAWLWIDSIGLVPRCTICRRAHTAGSNGRNHPSQLTPPIESHCKERRATRTAPCQEGVHASSCCAPSWPCATCPACKTNCACAQCAEKRPEQKHTSPYIPKPAASTQFTIQMSRANAAPLCMLWWHPAPGSSANGWKLAPTGRRPSASQPIITTQPTCTVSARRSMT